MVYYYRHASLARFPMENNFPTVDPGLYAYFVVRWTKQLSQQPPERFEAALNRFKVIGSCKTTVGSRICLYYPWSLFFGSYIYREYISRPSWVYLAVLFSRYALRWR